MTLDPACLAYPRRREGMDHDLYPYSALFTRPDVRWPGGRKIGVGVLVSLEWFPIVPGKAPFKAPGHMQTAYPDYRHYTSREYGTRVGFYRLLDAFAQRSIRASIAVNAAIAERYPSIIADIMAAGHEIIAHATDMDATIDSTVAEADERAIIRASRDRLAGVSGVVPRGWLSIARQQSWNTPRLLVEEGFAYACDWVNDDMPYVQTTAAGPLVAVPFNHELSDRQIITVEQHSAESYVEQMQDACNWLAGEAHGRMLPLHVTPYIMGLPFRMAAFEALLDWLIARGDCAFLTGAQLAAPCLEGLEA